MPAWIKKTLVALITVFTFGLVTPPSVLLDTSSKADRPTRQSLEKMDEEQQTEEESADIPEITPEDFISYAVEEAEKQSMIKFGSKIGPVIEKEFKSTILPRIEDTLAAFTEALPSETVQHLAVSPKPKGGENEKIFHVYNSESGKDLLRFHVRRDNPPKDGYYFNFHYHSTEDNFLAHNDLGKIYWSKNKPPQWLS
ncbi:YpjP family protein [Bacillus sp. 165]|uniref:YpjP family protein n=1 Tax=Bacillus sp. 165 TaxID=1529117 RepID=UPI001ADBAB1D|nr:YpjP family protein [Bacillus sp. 165]MBO9129350.1 YpjP family protein [Bacillus sp. 165]